MAVAFSVQLSGEFLWDDPMLVVDNQLTGDWRNLPRFFTVSLWETTLLVDPNRSFYRPLMLVELALDRTLIDPPAAWLHRLHNGVWHLGATLALHQLLQRLRPGAWLAFPAAALYALHPLQNEVVAFTAARNDAMAAALMCGALLTLLPQQVSRRRLVGGVLLFAGALLSKEVAVATPVILVGLDRLVHGRIDGWHRHGTLVAVIAAWTLLRLGLQLDVALVLPDYLTTWALHSGEMLLAPWRTSPTAYLDAVQPGVLPAAGVTVGVLALALRGGPQARLGLVWAVLTLLPCLPAVAGNDQMPYRYLSLPLAGLAMAVHAVWPERLSPWIGVGLAAGLAGLTLTQAPQWRDSASLWQRGHELGPSSRSACGVFKVVEDQPEAADWLARALGPPPAQHCCFSATRFFLDRGDPAGAVASGRTALARGCDPSAELLAPLAVAEAATGDWVQAEQHAGSALPDPTGLAPVVLSAAAKRRGDRTVLEHWAAQSPGGQIAALEAQVDWLLGLGGE